MSQCRNVSYYDIAIIGAGPGGYVSALRSSQLGLKTVVIDSKGVAEPFRTSFFSIIGGTCLNEGCIPSKTLLNASLQYWKMRNSSYWGINTSYNRIDLDILQRRKNEVIQQLRSGIKYLFSKNKIDFVNAEAKILDHSTIGLSKPVTFNGLEFSRINTKNIVIATGATGLNLPNIDNVDEEIIVTNKGALEFTKIPDHLVIIGGGVIGLELGTVWHRLGSQVTILEFADTILSNYDQDIKDIFLKNSQENFCTKIITGAQVREVTKDGNNVQVSYEVKNSGDIKTVICDKVLLSVGRKPNTKNLGLENIGVNVDYRGYIPIDHETYRVIPYSNIYAIGDVIGGQMLAHKAEEEGIFVAEFIANGKQSPIHYDAIPTVIYTHPEIASVGFSEQDLILKQIPFKKGIFRMNANSRARVSGDIEGFVKVFEHSETKEILGSCIISANAGEIIHELALAYRYRASCEDIARLCHAHPTLSEAIKEACWSVSFGSAIHM
ncbi:dihydrolipoamide dehydrogenase family protein [Cryptosporidium andersoni]|uniref:Dihydrolipoyl dehydrogenase n=1 Tax=Cryptosporidium andersoni TaxID=117008 RepID=A0A1J4MT24_9CRYT|nr:dihydrolipoamide dehydrogenase family protein [Cryptosporidium andersoni]